MSCDVHIVKAPARHSLAELARAAAAPLAAIGAVRALAFGSYARGEADGFSDLDIVVVLETALAPALRIALLDPLLRALPLTVNAFVYTPCEFARGTSLGLGVFDAIARDGVVFYARSAG